MKELTARQVNINDPFWSARLDVNATHSIFHQWEQLEATRCIDNFRIAAGQKDGFREGWFFADSDAYKWLDAASRIHALHPQPRLASLMDSFIAVIARTQTDDGSSSPTTRSISRISVGSTYRWSMSSTVTDI